MKIILFGKSGMLGSYIYSYFKTFRNDIEIIPVESEEYRVSIDSFLTLEELLIKKCIDSNTCVINCIGCIPQRKSDSDNQNYYIINTLFPHLLSKFCKKYNAKLIHPTTDCVYTGISDKGMYIESDFHDEKGHYGMSKSLGEPSDSTVIRCSIIGEELKNKKSFLEFVKNSKGVIQGWDNHMWNGITCLQYAKIIEQIIDNNLYWKGIRHLYSPTPISKFRMAELIKNTFNIDVEIKKTSTPTCVNKTLFSSFNTNELFKIPELETQIKMLKNFKFIL